MKLSLRDTQYRATILRKVAKGYVYVTTVKINIDQEKFMYKDHTYIINLKDHVYTSEDKKTVLFYELNGDQINFSETESVMDSSELDIYLSKKIIGQLVQAVKDKLGGGTGKGIILWIILGSIMGFLAGFMVSQMAFPAQHVIEVFKNATGTYPIVP